MYTNTYIYIYIYVVVCICESANLRNAPQNFCKNCAEECETS